VSATYREKFFSFYNQTCSAKFNDWSESVCALAASPPIHSEKHKSAQDEVQSCFAPSVNFLISSQEK